MKRFDYVRPQTCAEASGEMENGAVYMAGGSDLLGELKQDILPKYPKKVVSLRDIPELKGVAVEDGKLKVGAMTTLAELTESEAVASAVPALAEAAHSVATPLVRGIGTIGGNICQDVRCWFYRYPNEIGGSARLRPQGRRRVLRPQGRQPLPLHLRRHEGREPRRLLRRLPEQHGHRRLHGKAPRGRLGRGG